MKKSTIPIRNPVARSPLLRKGGAHVKSKTGQRVRAWLTTSNAVDEWLDEFEDTKNNSKNQNGEQMLPELFMGVTNRVCYSPASLFQSNLIIR